MPILGWFFFLGLGLVCLTLALWLLFHVLSMLGGAPYVASRPVHMREARQIIVNRRRVADIGSGNGDLLLALAEQNGEVHGFEINPFLVLVARVKIRRKKLGRQVFAHWKNFWQTDFSGFDAVYVFGLPPIMGRLGEKLRTELPDGVLVVSAAFPFPDWIPQSSESRLFVYTQPIHSSQTPTATSDDTDQKA